MSQFEELHKTVGEIIDLLASHGDSHLVRRLQGYQERLTRCEPGIARTLLSEATGGAGSLRDRYLSASNGDPISDAERDVMNQRLSRLVVRLADQARPARTSDMPL